MDFSIEGDSTGVLVNIDGWVRAALVVNRQLPVTPSGCLCVCVCVTVYVCVTVCVCQSACLLSAIQPADDDGEC